MASRITIPKPSKRELSAKTEARASSRPRCRVAPGKRTRVLEPEPRAPASAGGRPRPRAPWRRSVHPGRRGATRAQASSSRSNPFWCVRRPAAATTGASSAARGPSERRDGVRDPHDARGRARQQPRRSRARRPRSARSARPGAGSARRTARLRPGRCEATCMCSWPTVSTPSGARWATTRFSAGRVATRTSARVPRSARASWRSLHSEWPRYPKSPSWKRTLGTRRSSRPPGPGAGRAAGPRRPSRSRPPGAGRRARRGGAAS